MGSLQACDPRREPFDRELAVGSIEPIASENDGVGDAWVTPYKCVCDEGAKGMTDENEVCRLADRSVYPQANRVSQGR